MNYFIVLKTRWIKSIQRLGLDLIIQEMIENSWREVGHLYRHLNSDPIGSFFPLVGFLFSKDHKRN